MASNHMNWAINNCHVESFITNKVMLWRKKNETWKKECIMESNKNTGFFITIWACVGWNGIGPVRILNGRLTSKIYLELLNDVKEEIITLFGNDFIFLDDNCSAHRAAIITKQKKENKINYMDFCPQSPDLNIIENVWSELKRRLVKFDGFGNSKQRLRDCIIKSWSSISTSFIRKLIKTMNKRCRMVKKKIKDMQSNIN